MKILRSTATAAATVLLICFSGTAAAEIMIHACLSWAEARTGFQRSAAVASWMEDRTDEDPQRCGKHFFCGFPPSSNGGANFTEHQCDGSGLPTAGCFTTLTYYPLGSIEFYDRGGPTGGLNIYCTSVVTDGVRREKGFGDQSGVPCLTCGNPINGSNGNKFQLETDVAPPYEGGLEFKRAYNSLDGEVSVLGAHWRHTWDRTIAAVDVYAAAVRPDGKQLPFNKVGGLWVGDADLKERLVELTDTWVLTLANEDVEVYDKSGQLLSLTNNKGQVTTLAYSDGTDSGPNGGVFTDIAPPAYRTLGEGMLVSVTDYKGRQLKFYYNHWGRLTQVVDSDSNSFTYLYEASVNNAVPVPRLLGVTYPDGSSRAYLYDEPAYVAQQDPAHPFSLTGITETLAATTQNPNPTATRIGIYRYDSTFKATSTEGLVNWNPQTQAGTSVNQHAFTYGLNYTVTHQDPLGHSETVTFTPVQGLLRKAKTSRACPGCTGVDANGNYNESYEYDANGNVKSYTDFNNNLTCYTYDLARNLETSRTEGLQPTSPVNPCASAATTSATRTISTTWRSSTRQPKVVTEPLRVTTYHYQGDTDNSITYNCAPGSAPATLLCAKELQAITSVGANDGAARVISYTYNAAGQLLTEAGPRPENLTTYTYYTTNDPGNNFIIGDLSKVTRKVSASLSLDTNYLEYLGRGLPRKLVDPNGLETILAYTSRGWLQSRSIGTAASGYELTSYEYGPVGELTKITSPDGSTISYTYDGIHRLTDITDGLGNHIHYTLDTAGNRTLEESFDTQPALVRKQGREMDILGRLLKLIAGTPRPPPADPNDLPFTQYGYDGNGNPVTTTDPLLRVTTQKFDARNRLTDVLDPFNGSAAPTKYEYNGRDQLTKVTDPGGLATTYTVNGHGETTGLNSPDTGVTTYTYDAASNLASKTDARAVLAAYAYDGMNRVTTITYPDETVTYAYDTCTNGLGRLCSITDKTGTTSYAYNVKGRVTSKSQVVGTVTQTVQYGYNAAGQLSSITLPSGRQFTYGYSNNRVFSIAMTAAGTTTTILDGVFYEPFGPNGGWRWGNSTTNFHLRVYDKDFRPTGITSEVPLSNGHFFFDKQLTWDAQGRVTGIADLANSGLNATYGYDALDRVTSANQGASSSWGYVYDGVGNRTSTTVNGGSSTTYTAVPASNRLASLSGAQSKAYQYDAAGNMTSDGSTTWVFGGNNRATQAGATTSLINALGQRVKKGSGALAVRFLYDESGRLLGEYDDSGNALRENVWLDDLPVAVIQ
jgi:YD repeat-containing protein